MYIEKINIQNYGPITNLDITPQFDQNGNPLPTIILGKNGTGKTLFISSILDSLIELKRKKYSDLPEVKGNSYLKVGKKNYIKINEEFSYINIKLKDQNNTAEYTDLMTNIERNSFHSRYPSSQFSGFTSSLEFTQTGFYKELTIHNDEIKESLNKNLILFFPHSRYDHPAWLNKETKIGFEFKDSFINQSTNSIIKNNVIKEIEVWLLDCLLDREVYEKALLPVNLPIANTNSNSLTFQLNHFNGYDGKNHTILTLLNEILKIIYQSKFPDVESARLGFGAKGNRTIEVIIKEKGKEELQVSPSFSHLSSGEVMILALFASLLKEYDDLKLTPNSLNELTGIVIIDEIDLHLHIEFQKTVLPELIARFPKIQFFITTHSPFFLLGMEEKLKEKHNLISLPYGNEIKISEFSEMQIAYDLFVSELNSLQNTFKTVNESLERVTKTLVITEGKTDWKHLKAALHKLQNRGIFNQLDFEFLEYGDEIQMGDSHLKSLCEQYAKVPQQRKIICIFDRDSRDIINTMDGNGGKEYRYWGNSVYSFCIPIPSHRTYYRNISIEFYYKDADIKLIDLITNKRLFFSNEFEEVIRKSTTIKNKTESSISILPVPKQDEETEKKIYDSDVSKIVDNCGNQIAHSKNVFAENILHDKLPFNNVSIDEFEKIFFVIEKILKI